MQDKELIYETIARISKNDYTDNLRILQFLAMIHAELKTMNSTLEELDAETRAASRGYSRD